MGRGAGGRRWVSWRGSTSRWSGCSRGRCGDFFASTGRASSFWADAGVAARRRRRGAGGGRPIRGRSMVAGLVVELGRRERAAKDADMERLRWSAPRGGRGHSGCGRRLAVSQFYTTKQGEDRIPARGGMRYGLGMSSLWLVVAGYFALVLGLLIAVGLAPEGHEDVRGFHFIKPQADDAGAGRSAAAGSKSGRENALVTKGNE